MFSLTNHKQWRYKNTILLVFSIVLFFIFADLPIIHSTIAKVGDWGYLGAFIVGIFVVTTFTTAPALVVLYYLAERLNPLELAFFAGLGSVVGDFLIFRFFKDRIFVEFEPFLKRIGRRPFMHFFHSRHFAWLTPVLGALIIASPLPDEFGLALLSGTHFKKWQFFFLMFALDSLGILLIIKTAHLILE